MTDPQTPPPQSAPPGLREQLLAVRDAVRRLLGAHIELARTEAGEIASEIGKVALLAGVAIGALIGAALLITIGGALFLGEWIFGSIGWGVTVGVSASVAVAVGAVLVALGAPSRRLGAAVLPALVVGILFVLPGVLLHAGLRPWAGLGVTMAFLAWAIAAGYLTARDGIDTDALKARFYPATTIETTKETIEWVRERTPLGPKS